MDYLVVPDKCYISGPNNSEFWSQVQCRNVADALVQCTDLPATVFSLTDH
jgi:hypothetical protein